MKSTYTEVYQALLVRIIAARKEANLTQAELARRLSRPQSFISKIETGERRIDVVEFIEIARHIPLDPAEVVEELAGRMD